MDTVPNAKETLNLYEFTFENVAAGVDEVTIHLESPIPGELALKGGDSAAMIGAAVSYECGGVPEEETGSITIVKEIFPTFVQAEDWQFTGSLGAFSLPGSGGQTQFTDLTPGSFTITETPVEGWYSSVECDSGETSQSNEIVVQLNPGEDIVCTFLNVLPQ